MWRRTSRAVRRRCLNSTPPAGLQQRASDDTLGPREPLWLGAKAWQLDFGGALAVVTGDVAAGASAEQGLDAVRLLVLINDWRLQRLLDDERAAGCAPPLHGLPASAFAPVVITPDELGSA